MYCPHEAREDTVLFPALRTIVTPKELGKEGFEGVVEQVAKRERTLGIHELSQFTPP